MKGNVGSKTLYEEDLANIHVEGYGFHWTGAADAITEWLKQFKISEGLIVDLGCGGGQWLERLCRLGYQTYGIDVSSSMIKIAKSNSPNSKFVCGSFAEITIPDCDAVTSLGEPLNYLNSGPAMRRTMQNVYAALRQGGVFIFDVRHPSRTPTGIRETHRARAANDWFCHSRTEEDASLGKLTRYITTFRRTKDESYRRDEEIHRLKLFSRNEMMIWLREIGFRVKTSRSYASYKLGPNQSVFICRKP